MTLTATTVEGKGSRPHAAEGGNGQDMAGQIALLSRKIDILTDHVAYMAERQRSRDELKADLTPVAREAYDALVTELAQLEHQFTLEDAIELFRKLLRNVRTLSALFDQLDSVTGLLQDVGPLGKEVFGAASERLDRMERDGYFAFLGEVLAVADRVMTSFSPEDVRQLGDNVVFILQTVRSLTQPDILRMLNRSVSAVRRDASPPPKGILGLLKALRDDQVRRGLGVAIDLVKELAPNESESPETDAPALEAPAAN